MNRARTLVSYLLSSGMVANQYKKSQRALKPYPVQEYLTDVFHAVWKPLGKEGDKQDYYRRQLERAYVHTLNQDINADPSKDKSTLSLNAANSDARLFLLQHLDTVETFCRKQQASLSSNSLNALHYAELIHEIELIRKKYDKAE